MEPNESKPENPITDKPITFSVKEIIAYSAFLITFGASIYTFFNAIPELKRLGDETHRLNVTVAVSQTKIDALRNELEKLNK